MSTRSLKLPRVTSTPTSTLDRYTMIASELSRVREPQI
jgi:hypothetical protein